MTAAHSHLSSLCKPPSVRNGHRPNDKQESSAEYRPLGWATERLSGPRLDFSLLLLLQRLTFKWNWCALAGRRAFLTSGTLLLNKHSAAEN